MKIKKYSIFRIPKIYLILPITVFLVANPTMALTTLNNVTRIVISLLFGVMIR